MKNLHVCDRAPDAGSNGASRSAGATPLPRDLWQVWQAVGEPVAFDVAYERAEAMTVRALVVPVRS